MKLDGGTDVVLLPGFMLDEAIWRDTAAALSRIGPLHHGHLRDGDCIAAMAHHIVAKADFPRQFVLIGFSLGGYVAREIARSMPERVLALVLIATSARADSPQRAQHKAAAAAMAPAATFRGLSRAAIAASLHPDHADNTALIEQIRAMGVRLGRDVFVRQSGLQRGSENNRSIRCPTLVVAAAQDQLRGLDEAQELRDSIAGAALEVIADSGHMIPMEQPERLTKVILDWLGGLPA